MADRVVLLILWVLAPLTLAGLWLWARWSFNRLVDDLFPADEHATAYDRRNG